MTTLEQAPIKVLDYLLGDGDPITLDDWSTCWKDGNLSASYWRPSRDNFPGIDAVVLRREQTRKIIWALQIIIASTHSNADIGLEFITDQVRLIIELTAAKLLTAYVWSSYTNT